MPRILLNFIRERQRSIINRLEWEKRKQILQGERIVKGRQEGQAQREWRTTQPYDFSQKAYLSQYKAVKKSPNVTLPPPNEPSLGLDWSITQSRSFNPSPAGPREGVPKAIVNRGGSVVNLKPKRLHGKSEVQQTRRHLSYQETDQKPIRGRRSSGGSWDGVIRNTGTRPSYLTASRKAATKEPEPSIYQDPYSFY